MELFFPKSKKKFLIFFQKKAFLIFREIELFRLKLKKPLYFNRKLAKPGRQIFLIFKKVLPNFWMTADQFACFL